MGEDEPGEAGRWKFSSVGEAAMYAEEAADIIVEVMRKLSGNLLVNSVDSEIYKAMAYVSGKLSFDVLVSIAAGRSATDC